MKSVVALVLAGAACGATPREAPRASTPIPSRATSAVEAIRLEPPFGGPTWHDAPPAPLDVVGWLDERDCIIGFRCHKSELRDFEERARAPVKVGRTHRLSGPATLDAEVAALDAEVCSCLRAAARGKGSAPRMRLTVDAHALPVRIVDVDPSDAPSALVGCITDALRDVRTLAPEPVVIVAGPAALSPP